jgi:hypothetical protein
MADTPSWRRVLEYVLSIGSDPGEPETRGGGRRVVVVAIIVATLLTIPTTLADLSAGYGWVAAVNLFVVVVTPVALVAIKRRPHRFAPIVTAVFVLVFLVQLAETAMFGGLLPSGLVVVFGLALVLGSLLAIGLRAAIWWFVAFAASVPDWVDPIYQPSDPAADAAFNLIATGILVLAVLAYFARQRDSVRSPRTHPREGERRR